MFMKKQQKFLIIIAVIVVVLLIIVFGVKKEREIPEALPDELLSMDLDALAEVPEIALDEITEPIEIAPGASLVSGEGIVVNEEGEPVKTEGIAPMSEGAPDQSKVLNEEEKEQIAENVISMEVNQQNGFTPKQFKVKPGQVVTVLLTATDNRKHEFRFRDDKLRAVTVVVKSGESRATTFNAPTQMGLYEFFCFHHDIGRGQMIVIEE